MSSTQSRLADRRHARLMVLRVLVIALLATLVARLWYLQVRTGQSGALEKPYRSNNETWWLDGPLAIADAETRFAPIEIF